MQLERNIKDRSLAAEYWDPDYHPTGKAAYWRGFSKQARVSPVHGNKSDLAVDFRIGSKMGPVGLYTLFKSPDK